MPKTIIKLLSMAAIVVGFVVTGSSIDVAAQAPGVNLLTNGDFEAWDYGAGHWPMMWGIPEVQICPGWQAYWVQDPPEEAPMQENWKRPEFRDVKITEASYRVRSGNLAQKYFSFGGQHIAGLYQQVSGITPGTTLRFEAYMQTWGCMAGDQGWNICPTGHTSNSPSPFHTRVGIDPTGGTSPGAGTVIWGPEIEAYDQWTHFQVEAVAQNSTVTVFTFSHADWWDNVFRMHNDVYIDDASLIALDVPLVDLAAPEPAPVVEEVAPAAEEAQPAAEVEMPEPAAEIAPLAPVATPTARPNGAVVHVVQSGDTLLAISLAYDIDPEKIKALNDVGDGNWLTVGQELVISVDPAAVAPAAAAVEENAALAVEGGAVESPTVLPTPTPQPTVVAASQPVALAEPVSSDIALPTPTPRATAAQSRTASTVAGAPAAVRKASGVGGVVIPLILAVASGVGLGVVLNGRIKRG